MLKLKMITVSLATACLAFSLSAQAKVTVFAAASMTNALNQIAEDYKKSETRSRIGVFFCVFFNACKTN